MTYIDKHIVDSYSDLFEGLNSISKSALIKSLSKSLKAETKTKENLFYKSFGAFASDKSAEAVITELRDGRKFTKKIN